MTYVHVHGNSLSSTLCCLFIYVQVGAEMLKQIPILRKLRQKEMAAGKDVQIKVEGESAKDVGKTADGKSEEPAMEKGEF